MAGKIIKTVQEDNQMSLLNPKLQGSLSLESPSKWSLYISNIKLYKDI